MPNADVIAHYSLDTAPRFEADECEGRGKKPRQKRDFLKRMQLLLDYWGDKVVDDIDKKTCREFTALHARSTARRCLEDLRAAVNLAVADNKLAKDGDQIFEIPPPNPPRFRFFTRNQIARLLKHAYRKKGSYTHTEKRSSGEIVGVTKETTSRPMRHLARFLLTGVYTGTRTERIEQASFEKEFGRPWIDLENGIYYRSWDGELVPDNKRANPIRIPPRLLAHMRRWHANGAKYLVEFNGRPVGTASAFFRLLRDVLDEDERKGLNRHATKHTCATWLMQGGEPLSDIADYLSTDEKTIIKHYGHHHPNHHVGIGRAFSSGKAGRPRSRRDIVAATAAAERPTAANNPVLAEEVRRAIRELMELFEAPVAVFPVLVSTPDSALDVLREQIKRAARSGNWNAVLGKEEDAA